MHKLLTYCYLKLHKCFQNLFLLTKPLYHEREFKDKLFSKCTEWKCICAVMPDTKHAFFYVRCLFLKFYSNSLCYDKQNYNKIALIKVNISRGMILSLLAIFLFLNIHFQCTVRILTVKNGVWMQLKTQKVQHIPTSSQSGLQRDWFGGGLGRCPWHREEAVPVCRGQLSCRPFLKPGQPCGAPAASGQGFVCLCTLLHTIFISWKFFPYLPFSCPWFLLCPDCI